ncbi:MAG TPA: hypothetical protein VHP99_07960 [Pyrinomonadaceae bacterium]|jgi:hypothetical protein|nr:hypothetical protein [Pyrinomonadaceae bacterium]
MHKTAIASIKSIPTVVSIILCSFIVAHSQSPTCSLKASELKPAADLYALHLGMTTEDVKKALPLVEFGRADRIGVMRTSFNPHFDPRVEKTSFPDVRTISLDFLDGKLVTVWIGYESTFKWPKLDDFITNFSQSLGVSPNWQTKRNGRQLDCDGFSITAQMIGGGPSLRISDHEAQNVATARLAEAIDEDEKQVVGDQRTKSYYPSDCSAKDSVPQASRTIFKNKEDAEKAGYALSKDCQ